MATRLLCALTVVLCFLAFAASAHAECAWVLWVRGQTSQAAAEAPGTLPGTANQASIQAAVAVRAIFISRWQTYSASKTHAECDAAARGTDAIKRTLLAQHQLDDPTVLLFVQCLPDTVDPREPKGR
jgi:hypothetical protein